MSCRRHQVTSPDALKIHLRGVLVLRALYFDALESELGQGFFDKIQDR